ncbi:alpha/beta hydrolase [Pseudolysinimonas kribbensis]|uniref:Alpha/beta hydrolase n=1 Tax=Pseudolysinimonas kribbensis TaxID=433641 RepID=A0ABQ6K9S5_9MICO|nr:alpha/beta hydrolase [Pseudolysinimonas kribbensis]GMA96350.1 alpha/beta hydrolase [Pseudolysinimonas kribbensis]
MTTPLSLTIPTSFGDVPLTADERGEGRAIVILHGGAGPASVTGFADLLAEQTGSRVIAPSYPGFGGTPRPEALTTIAGLAELIEGMLDALDLDDVTVIGNSMGGWITAELALRHPSRLGRIVLVDAVGIEVTDHPVADFFALTPAQIAERSWYDPSKAPSLDPSALPPAAREVFAGNRASLALYGGSMADASLLGRLGGDEVPALVLWGEADRIVDVAYGRAYAAGIPRARFEVLAGVGHVPQMEGPEVLLTTVARSADTDAG